MLALHAQAYGALKPLAVEIDLEKYYDIYEISQSDIQEIEGIALGNETVLEDAETLKVLKVGLQRLQLVRKLFLCSLLALDADGGKPDFARWAAAIEMMQRLSSRSADAAEGLDSILSEEGCTCVETAFRHHSLTTM